MSAKATERRFKRTSPTRQVHVVISCELRVTYAEIQQGVRGIFLVVAVLLIAGRAWGVSYQVSAWSFGDAASLAAAADRGAIDEISVDWYASQRDGTVGTLDGEDLTVVSDAHARALRVLATVTDKSLPRKRWSSSISTFILKRPTSMAQHIEALVALCMSKGYDGIDIDWEKIHPHNKDKLSAFIAQLADALHQNGKILAMDLQAKVAEPGGYWVSRSEDWAALGAALDEFKVMTYDYSGSWSPPGPIAPLAWVDTVLTHAESLVPAAKIMMGIPFYGYDWARGRTTDVFWSDAQTLISTYQPTVMHDPSSEATFTYTDAAGVPHTVYFQDRTSLAAKLQLLRAQHPTIGGIAIWVMSQEDPAFWEEIAAQLR